VVSARPPALLSASRTRDDPPRHQGGIARSRDGGGTWQRIEADYTRATIVPPARPDLVLAGPAPRVGRGGRIVVSADGGDTWQPAGTGVDIPMPDMVELFVAAPDDSFWAICFRGRLLRASPENWSWSSPLPFDADERQCTRAWLSSNESPRSCPSMIDQNREQSMGSPAGHR
jgi:hypothetical protein